MYRIFLENISPDDQQQRNDPILLPVSEDPKTATRFSDPILHRAENTSISRIPAETQSPIQNSKQLNPKKALFKHLSIEYVPFIVRLPKNCQKGLKRAKSEGTGPNFSRSKISRGSACDTKLFYSLHRRPGHQSLSRTVTQKFRRSRNRRSALIRMRSSVNQ